MKKIIIKKSYMKKKILNSSISINNNYIATQEELIIKKLYE